jgi:hypothetical protein
MSYLILHKVRGEPAFDIADKLQIGDEEGWIIPTSGHRAYPLWAIPLVISDDGSNEANPWTLDDCTKYYLEEWPDHYPMDVGVAPKPNFNIMAAISNLLPKINRRV